MAISVTQPVDRALQWTKQVLFRPFSLSKWLVLGFCVFLANLVGGGCQPRFSYRHGGGGAPGGGGGGNLEPAADWLRANAGLVLLIFFAGMAVVLAVTALLMWLSSRGKFMFLDGVVHNRAAVVEPWKRFRTLGNSLFKLRFLLLLAWMFAGLLILLVCGVLAWPDITAERFGGFALAAVILGVLFSIALAFVMMVVSALLTDFVVPIMYFTEQPATPAFGDLWRRLVRPYLGTFVLFYLLRIALGIATGIIVFVGTCLTCCIAGLPYISSVVFLPIFVFFRSFSLFFLEQFRENWDLGIGGEEIVEQPGG